MRYLRRGDDRWFQRFWRFVDVDGAAAAGFPEPAPGDTPAQRLDAILTRLGAAGLVYADARPFSGPGGGQEVRSLTRLDEGTPATCIDVVALTAAACVLAGLRSWPVVSDDGEDLHAWLVVDVREPHRWTDDYGLRSEELFMPWESRGLDGREVEDPAELAEIATGGGTVVLDPTRLCHGYQCDGPPDPRTTWEEMTHEAIAVEVCDVGHWWTRTWLLDQPGTHVHQAFVTDRPLRTVVEPPMVARPVLDQLCDEWLASDEPALLLVGHGGRGATSALRRLVRSVRGTAELLLVAAAPWNRGRWVDHDARVEESVSDDSLGQRLLQRLVEQWTRDAAATSVEDALDVRTALDHTGDRWTAIERTARRLPSGPDLIVVVDGLEPKMRAEAGIALMDGIVTLHRFGRDHPDVFRRRIRTIVASEREPRLIDKLNAFVTIDLDEVDGDPSEVAARAKMLARSTDTPPDVTAEDSTWAEIALWMADHDADTGPSNRRMTDRLSRLRDHRVGADGLLGVLLAARGPLPRRSLAELAGLGHEAENLLSLVQPWLIGDAASEDAALHSAARRWLLANDSTSQLVSEGHRRLAEASLRAVEHGAEELTRYADLQLVPHVLATSLGDDQDDVGRPPDADLVARTRTLLSDPSWQDRLAYREGVAEANGLWRSWLGSLGVGRDGRPVYHDVRSLVSRPRAGVRLPWLRRQQRGPVFQAAGGDRTTEVTEVIELGLRIERIPHDGGVTVRLRAPEAWRASFVHLTVTADGAVDDVELLVPLPDTDVPQTQVDLAGQTLETHDVQVGSPLSVAQVALLDPALLARSRRLSPPGRAARLWERVDAEAAP